MDLVNKLLKEYYDSSERLYLRLGQWFVTNYVSEEYLPWPELFYCENTTECVKMIDIFLQDNGYKKRLPKRIV